MNEKERVRKKCLLGQPDGTRPRGRPKARYMELIEKDLEKYQISFRELRFHRKKNLILKTFRNQLKNPKCCKNYQISSEFREKTPWTLPTFIINFHYFSLAIFSSRNFGEQIEERVIFDKKIVHVLRDWLWDFCFEPVKFD